MTKKQLIELCEKQKETLDRLIENEELKKKLIPVEGIQKISGHSIIKCTECGSIIGFIAVIGKAEYTMVFCMRCSGFEK